MPAQIKKALSSFFKQQDIQAYSLEKRQLLELATISQPIIIQYRGTKGIWPINSELTLQGTFDVKFGFDLNNFSAITVDSGSLRAHISVQPPRILSIEQKEYLVLGDNQSIWSSFSASEQTEALNGMLEYAKQISLQNNANNSALDSLRSQLESIATGFGGSVKITITQPPKGPADASK